MGCADLVQEEGIESQAMVALTQLEVQLLADKIAAEIFNFGQKSVSKMKIIGMVADELQKLGVLKKSSLNKGDASWAAVCPQSCIQVL